jgi:hypothetical protein
MIRDTPVAEEFQANLSGCWMRSWYQRPRRELDALRYGIAMARRY